VRFLASRAARNCSATVGIRLLFSGFFRHLAMMDICLPIEPWFVSHLRLTDNAA